MEGCPLSTRHGPPISRRNVHPTAAVRPQRSILMRPWLVLFAAFAYVSSTLPARAGGPVPCPPRLLPPPVRLEQSTVTKYRTEYRTEYKDVQRTVTRKVPETVMK